MEFRFQPLRATQAAGVLVRLAGGRLNYTKLLKLLHLADRHSLLETGSPITGDAVVNMTNGPVLSAIYNCIKSDWSTSDYTWSAAFRTEGYELVQVRDAGDSELSDYDVEVLETLYRRYQSYSLHEMIEFVHTLPEWSDPWPAGAVPVSHDDILRAAGTPPETIRAYDDLNASVETLDRFSVSRH